MKVKASGGRTRQSRKAAFKAGIALAAPREDRTIAQVCGQFERHANQISEWKKQLPERSGEEFDRCAVAGLVDLAPLQATVGPLALENYFFKGALAKSGLLSAKP